VLEFSLPAAPVARALWRGYMRSFVPWLAATVAGNQRMRELMRYTWETIETCVPPATIMRVIGAAGFREISREVEVGIFSAYRASRPAA
jgi:demethylmenaquinone methyltransferase/2-methoxy-6-polyprenyl-1,4-benzoquinol methylase